MAQDITLPIEDGFFNLRVGAIILRDGKFLMVKSAGHLYCYSVGGRIRFGETAEQAAVREVEEETGVRLEIERLGFVEENYFYGDSPWNRGRLIYELAFYFYMKTPPDFQPAHSSFDEDGVSQRLEWVGPDTEKTIYPSFFRTELADPKPCVRHIVTDDRNQS